MTLEGKKWLVSESASLGVNLRKLEAFMKTSEFEGLDRLDRGLLEQQATCMRALRTTYTLRIQKSCGFLTGP